MLEKKINNLKNIIFVKGSICISLILCSIWVISFLKDDYYDAIQRLDLVRPMIAETRIKLHEITDSNSNVSEGLEKYNQIYSKTDEARCKEYQDLLVKIADLRTKYSLSEPIGATMSGKPSKLNISHNKASYISSYDLKIEFGAYDIAEVFEIYNDILSLLPEYSMVYFVSIKESSIITPKSIPVLRVDAKPVLMRGKIYIKLRDVVYTKSHF